MPAKETVTDPLMVEFCQRRALAIFSKETPMTSWREVFGDTDMTEDEQKAECRRLLNLVGVKNKIAKISKSTLAKTVARTEYTAEKLLEFCVDVITSPPSAASMDNPHCELKMSKQGPYAAFPDKIAAASLYAKIKGLAQDVNVSINIPSWSPSAEANICEPVLEGEVVESIESGPTNLPAPQEP